MIVYVCMPSARPLPDLLKIGAAWEAQGYVPVVWRDQSECLPDSWMQCFGQYRGYYWTQNWLIGRCFDQLDCDWIVAAADDMTPDPAKTALEIAAECTDHFGGSFGVMQPTGDRWGEQQTHIGPPGSAYADRICGSPWIGRDFAAETYCGKGPYHEGYTHMFGDQELFEVAKRAGALWQRRDLTHYHHHWARVPSGAMPEFLREANSAEHWARYKKLFERRQAAGFPGAIA